jgi:long-chain fatty acid transport protein
MKLNSKLKVIGSALACGAGLAPTGHAGGLELYELATPDVGLASAGYAARAQDAI